MRNELLDPGLIAHPGMPKIKDGDEYLNKLAASAYAIAEAMMDVKLLIKEKA